VGFFFLKNHGLDPRLELFGSEEPLLGGYLRPD